MTESLSDSEVFEKIMDSFNSIEDYRVYYTMKLMRIRTVTDKMVERMKACLAIQSVGSYVTTHLAGQVLKVENRSQLGRLITALHNLGDRECLLLKRDFKHRITWMVNPIFLKYFEDPNYLRRMENEQRERDAEPGI